MELAEAVAEAFERDRDFKISSKFRYGDTRHIVSDITKLKTLGWKPINSVKKSVNNYVGWLRKENIARDVTESAQKKMKKLEVVQRIENK